MKRCLVALLATLIPVAKADFNDFVDPTYNCPARTTCPVICVSSVQNCPTKCEFGEQVCADGSCAVVCDESLESACEEDCANVACPKVDDFYNICQEKFGSYYEAVERCIEDEKADLHLLNFNETPYVFGYTW